MLAFGGIGCAGSSAASDRAQKAGHGLIFASCSVLTARSMTHKATHAQSIAISTSGLDRQALALQVEGGHQGTAPNKTFTTRHQFASDDSLQGFQLQCPGAGLDSLLISFVLIHARLGEESASLKRALSLPPQAHAWNCLVLISMQTGS